jgi:hypothetical protein
MGEPFLFGFEPKTLAADLRSCDLTLVEDLDNDQVAARYGRQDLTRSGASRLSHIALARVDP